MLRLKQIHAYVLRTIVRILSISLDRNRISYNLAQYATNKSKVVNGYIGTEFEQNIVSELDSSLNKFIDTIPDHRTLSLCSFTSTFDVILGMYRV